MSGRFTKLYSLDENIYALGSPVLIAAGALLGDMETESVIAQLKFINVCPEQKNITEICIVIIPHDEDDKQLGDEVNFSYHGMSLPKNAEYGTKIPVVLPDKNTVSIEVKVKSVSFEDGSTWDGAGLEWKPVAEKKYISAMINDVELVKQFRIENGNDCNFSYNRMNNLWYCVCGALNSDPDTVCLKCGKSEDIMKEIDLDGLRARKDERLAAEAEQRAIDEKNAQAQREAAEQRAADERAAASRKADMEKYYLDKRIEDESARQKKLMIIGGSAGATVIIIFLLITQYFIPLSKYNKALAYKRETDYDSAVVLFTKLGNFKDSKEQVTECKQKASDMTNNLAYIDANKLMANGQYDEAIEAFKAIETYKDSADMILECENRKAEAELKAVYDEGVELMGEEKYAEAIKKFDQVSDYEDAADLSEECENLLAYSEAEEAFENKEYKDAVEKFTALGDYEDASDKALDAMYSYVTDTMSSPDETTVEYLDKLIAAGYQNAENINNMVDRSFLEGEDTTEKDTTEKDNKTKKNDDSEDAGEESADASEE